MIRIGESKYIIDLVPNLANIFLKDYSISDELTAKYESYYSVSIPQLGMLEKYLNNQMSDFEVLSICKSNNSIAITINDLNYCLMAEEWIRNEKLDLEAESIKFPCTFMFHDIKHYSINEVKNDGEICEISDYSITENSQLLLDQLIYIDNKGIEIGFTLWKYIGGTGRNFLLLISAESFQVKETQIELFKKLQNGNYSEFKK